jgi:O-antigen biosynthesis alpha-1,2-rhamnosyltransferase
VLFPEAVTFRQGDTVLAAEPFLDRGYIEAFLGLRSQGAHLACIAYDLIPIRHPEYVPADFLLAFRHWVDRLVAGSDLVVAISAAIRADVVDYLEAPRSPDRPVGQRVKWFHLGHDLDRMTAAGAVRKSITKVFGRTTAGPVLLMVGWLDPRKNQLFVLDAMKILRRDGIRCQLLVIGKPGRAASAYYSRLKSDADLGRHVHTFHDATDFELAYCYRHAGALVYPSTTEGFGLPLVEALGHGARVFASDIPIFREIGEGFVSYFPLDDPKVLAEKLRRFCVDGVFDAPREAGDFQWPAWRESVARLLDIVLERPTGDALP